MMVYFSFLKKTVITFVLLGTLIIGRAQNTGNKRPNIIVIMTDQQHAKMLSCAGNPYVRTPNLDKLAASGTRFTRAYATNPVCLPSRTSMLTGLLPSVVGVECNQEANHAPPLPQAVLDNTLGKIFQRAGYDCIYGGKAHLLQALYGKNIPKYGFRNITNDERDELADKMSDYLLQQDHDKPFLMVASFINPHDICYMAVDEWNRVRNAPYDSTTIERQTLKEAMKIPAGISEEDFYSKYCPPLPSNHAIPEKEVPAALGLVNPMETYLRTHWTDKQWLMHRWAYKNLVEKVDGQIGRLLNALDKSGLRDNTIILFVSDHGEHDGAHHLEHKDVFYEESINVPFILSWKGKIKSGLVDSTHMVSTGLDIIPTLCDLADIAAPSALAGLSVKPLAEGQKINNWRKYIVAEATKARMVYDGEWKYMVSGDGKKQQMLIHFKGDKGEMNNLAGESAYKAQLEKSHQQLKEWYRTHNVKLPDAYN